MLKERKQLHCAAVNERYPLELNPAAVTLTYNLKKALSHGFVGHSLDAMTG